MMTKRVVVGLAALLVGLAAAPIATAGGSGDDDDDDGGRSQDCSRPAGHKVCVAVDEPRCGLGVDVDGLRYCFLPRLGTVAA